jgi:hypothetical protein
MSQSIDNGTEVFSIILPFELDNGNSGRSGKWFSSAKLRKKYEAELGKMGLRRVPFPYPVNVRLIRILGSGQREWDSSSWQRGNYKEIEDALVACGWFVDDGPKYIWETTFENDISRKSKGPCIELVITKAGNRFEKKTDSGGRNLL